MKFKVSAVVIILTTAAIIGVINLSLSRTTQSDVPAATKSEHVQEAIKPPASNKAKTITSHREPLRNDTNDDDIIAELDLPSAPLHEDRAVELAESDELSKEDIQKINGIVSLSESELSQQLNALRQRIEDEDLFGKLEEGLLSGEKEAEAKEALERFALLGLEGTRRKYMAIEPELKDPIYAFKDSLKEIRELLNDDFDDEF